MALVQFTDKDATTGKTRVVAVDPDKVSMLFQDFAESTKTALVCEGVVQWVVGTLATVEASLQKARLERK